MTPREALDALGWSDSPIDPRLFALLVAIVDELDPLPTTRRIRMELTNGATIDVNVSPDASPETLAALRNIGEAAAKRLGSTTSVRPQADAPEDGAA